MPRLACVDVPDLPLQLLTRQNPGWSGKPVAVVTEDRPTAPLRYVNEMARRHGILPGQRYAAALALCRDLRAGPVSDQEARGLVDELLKRLHRFAPRVEPSADLPGVFWLDASGFGRLYPRLSAWAKEIRADCAAAGVVARIAIGFRRFGTYAATRLVREARVFASPAEEKAATRRVPLTLVDLDANVRDDLVKLGIRTLGELVALPAEGILERYGKEAFALHRLAAGRSFSPLVPRALVEPPSREADLDHPESDAERLLFVFKQLLDPIIVELAARSQALTAVRFRLALDDRSERIATVRPASPTLEATQILNLLRLKLSTLSLPCGVVSLRLDVTGERATAEQIRLSIARARRDYDAMARAFARLRAEMGEDAVVRAVLRDGHLPRSGFGWEPILRLDPAGPRPKHAPARPLVRRIYDKPVSLPPRPRHEPDGWLLRGIEHGRVERFIGPYVISGGWWRTEIHRDYYFASMSGGDVLWIYYDRPRQRWFLEGRVE